MLLVWLGLGACTVTGDASPYSWTPFDPGNACAIEHDVFGPYCVSCHNGTIEPLDLRGAALASLPGMVGEYGLPIVVAGDPDASFIIEKVNGPAADHGDPMPQTGAMPDVAKAALLAWIEDGAPACATAGDDIIVGAPVAFGGPPSDYIAKHPSWAASGTCSSGQWWSHEGLTAASTMHPGYDCVGCHAQESGPGFAYAGTVYPTLHDPDDCRGVPGVKVEILDGDGAVVSHATTNAGGNFSIGGPYVDGYRTRLTYEGRTREMVIPAFGNKSCNTCHGPAGTEGAPGRVVAP